MILMILFHNIRQKIVWKKRKTLLKIKILIQAKLLVTRITYKHNKTKIIKNKTINNF